MIQHNLRCGNGNAIFTTAAEAQPEVTTPRLTVPLNFGSCFVMPGGYRLVAHLSGRTAVVVLADSLPAVIDAAWERGGDLPEGTLRLSVEKWVGRQTEGWWTSVRLAAGELPRVSRPTRSRGRLASRFGLVGVAG